MSIVLRMPPQFTLNSIKLWMSWKSCLPICPAIRRTSYFHRSKLDGQVCCLCVESQDVRPCVTQSTQALLPKVRLVVVDHANDHCMCSRSPVVYGCSVSGVCSLSTLITKPFAIVSDRCTTEIPTQVMTSRSLCACLVKSKRLLVTAPPDVPRGSCSPC